MLSPAEIERVEAAAFRSLVAHLRATSDAVSNIDLMGLAGFCRNCLAKWWLRAARALAAGGERAPTYEDACVAVYGEPYSTWKRSYQTPATPEQLARYESSKDLHAKHDEAPPAPRPPLSDVCCRDADALPVAEPTIPSRASSVVLRVGILTVSDRAAAGVYQDRSGPEVEACLRETAARVPGTWRLEAVRTTIVPDEEARIEATLREWLSASASACNLVLTTGGTGFAPRDVTPEATARVLTRRTPQLIELALRAATARGDAHGAALSRGIAGVVESNGMVVNLPGRPHAARENLAAMLPVLPHAVAQATGRV